MIKKILVMFQIWLLNWQLNLELASESSRHIWVVNVAYCKFGFLCCRFGFWSWILLTRHWGLEQEVACQCHYWKNSAGFVWLIKSYWSVLEENHFFRWWCWLSFLNWIRALTLSLLLKLPPRKLELWSVLWSFFLLRLLCISISH